LIIKLNLKKDIKSPQNNKTQKKEKIRNLKNNEIKKEIIHNKPSK